MKIPVILAHGALGPYDDLIMIGVSVVFIVMMGFRWIKSRSNEADFDEAEETADAPANTSDKDHFPLD